jgi:acid stress chaperone HdeB
MHREMILAAVILAATSAVPVTAQVRIDMSLITCKQYLTSDSERQEMIAAWMSGYFRASRNEPVVDFQRFERNKKAVGNYCKKNGGETLMSAIQRNAR